MCFLTFLFASKNIFFLFQERKNYILCLNNISYLRKRLYAQKLLTETSRTPISARINCKPGLICSFVRTTSL